MARAVALNLLKAGLLVAVLATAFAGLGWLVGGMTTALLFAFCSLLSATGVYRSGDRALLGMLGARPFADAGITSRIPVLRDVRAPDEKVEARLARLNFLADSYCYVFDAQSRTVDSVQSHPVHEGARLAPTIAGFTVHDPAHPRRGAGAGSREVTLRRDSQGPRTRNEAGAGSRMRC